jgi:hypothetical protein
MGTFAGVRRNFILLSYSGRSLREYALWINARDYGSNLEAGWYITYHAMGFKIRRYKPQEAVDRLDMFSQQDLISSITVASECLKKALTKLYQELNLNPVGMNTKSRGYLDIW